MNARKGDIFYIYKINPNKMNGYQDTSLNGSPAIIISGDEINQKEDNLIVVYLTRRPRAEHVAHVKISSLGNGSTALCEKIHTTHIDKIGDYMGRCTMPEMEAVEKAIQYSLALDDSTTKEMTDKLSLIETERDMYKRLYEEQLLKCHKVPLGIFQQFKRKFLTPKYTNN